MGIKIENIATIKLPSYTEGFIANLLKIPNSTHLHGLERVKIVDIIYDPRLRQLQKTSLPGLYHPRQGSQGAWIELAITPLLAPDTPFYKKLIPRLSFKNNVAAVLFSLIGQHYHLTLRHSVKKTQIESSVRVYTEKQLRLWAEKNQGLRARMFKPFQPILERWAKSLHKRAKNSRDR